jgi:thymidylate synthase (FAD)
MNATLVDSMGSDATVANAARVSFNKHKDTFDSKDEKLIEYLASHNHWTPFAHPQITLRIKAPISIRTQCFKHKVGFTENEISRRYVSDPPELFMPKWRKAPTDGAKQGSSGEIGSNLWLVEASYRDGCKTALFNYDSLLKLGVAPEQARFVLPQGVYTEWYWTGSLAAYARFYTQRTHDGAQQEVTELAMLIQDIVKPLYPVSWKALTTHGEE